MNEGQPTRLSVASVAGDSLGLNAADAVLQGLAEVFFRGEPGMSRLGSPGAKSPPNLEAKYRTLIEQIPAVVFMVNLDGGIGEAYVSPQIEEILGFSQEEWLEDPIRWYSRIHPEDKSRWSEEAAEMFLSGKPLRSVYRVLARDGHAVSFHCEAKMVRQQDGRPWFIHGVAFDITDLKRAELALEKERNFARTVLDTVDSLIVVLDSRGCMVRVNRACERASGYISDELVGRFIWDLLLDPRDGQEVRAILENPASGEPAPAFETGLLTRWQGSRLIAWSCRVLGSPAGGVEYIIMTGIDVTEAKRLEKAILDISAREQRRIGQDLHDGLGQHLTGIAFMSKSLAQRLGEGTGPEAAEASKIVRLVNEAINKTRELSHGLMPVFSEDRGLMSALERMVLEVEDLFRVSCRFECDRPALIRENDVATHLYHIAKEAVNNAIKHGQAKEIVIRFIADRHDPALSIEDDGVGIPASPNSGGMGLNIMRYRAKMIGGEFQIHGREGVGTIVLCRVPASHLKLE